MIFKTNFASTSKPTPPQPNTLSLSVTSKVVRVKDIVLDENHPAFNDVGQWNGIGTIFFETLEKGATTNLNQAKPFFPHFKNYPILNELVLILFLPNINIGENYSNKTWYYLSGINLWNHPHHNSYPDLNKIKINPTNQNFSYPQIENNFVSTQVTPNIPEDIFNSTNNPSQNTFIERDKIYPLLSFMGDNIIEGRWGNSIRLGSTAKTNSHYKNIWSQGTQTQNGDPILILRNGQTKSSNAGFFPIIENPNTDESSIWLTTTQKIPFNNNINELFSKFNINPTPPKEYSQPQTSLISDRILMYSKNENILIGAEGSINLSTNDFFFLNSRNIYIDTKNVKLGNDKAQESLILGDTFLNELNILINSLQTLCNVLTTSQIWPGGVPSPNAPLIIAANNLLGITQAFSSKIPRFKSKVSKTI